LLHVGSRCAASREIRTAGAHADLELEIANLTDAIAHGVLRTSPASVG